jgi:hypothetical protein
MTFLVRAIECRADGTEETRYSREFDNESDASLHADMVHVTWVDPKIKVVVEEVGGSKSEGIIVYTNAPPEYDYSYVEVIDAEYARYAGHHGGTHPIFRKIAIHATSEKERLYRREYQCGRYASGLYTSLSQEDFDRSVELGMIEVIDRTEVPPPSITGAVCPDCHAPASIDDVGTVCNQCHRGIVIGSSFGGAQ